MILQLMKQWEKSEKRLEGLEDLKEICVDTDVLIDFLRDKRHYERIPNLKLIDVK